mmetsp:Transcript_30534/g.73179  ORF Transcript_30534/g.73179 Transcript_30534/m.73179 type:complete len:281 (+) Transcript_30534:518-1360(+)
MRDVLHVALLGQHGLVESHLHPLQVNVVNLRRGLLLKQRRGNQLPQPKADVHVMEVHQERGIVLHSTLVHRGACPVVDLERGVPDIHILQHARPREHVHLTKPDLHLHPEELPVHCFDGELHGHAHHLGDGQQQGERHHHHGDDEVPQRVLEGLGVLVGGVGLLRRDRENGIDHHSSPAKQAEDGHVPHGAQEPHQGHRPGLRDDVPLRIGLGGLLGDQGDQHHGPGLDGHRQGGGLHGLLGVLLRLALAVADLQRPHASSEEQGGQQRGVDHRRPQGVS